MKVKIPLFRHEPNKERVPRGMYFVNRGEHTGRFIVFIDEHSNKTDLALLFMPENEPQTMTVADVDHNIKFGVLEYVEKLPKKVYEVCIAEYNYRITNTEEVAQKAHNDYIARRQQSRVSSKLDSEDPTKQG